MTRRSLLGSIAILGLLLAPVGRAEAADVEYGWWSAGGAPGGAPSSAPGAPTDGLYAAVGPSVPGITVPVPDVAGGQVPPAFAPLAVGAVRFAADPTSEATLTLAVTASSTPPNDAGGNLTFGLLACPISDPGWVPVQNGSFADRPVYECGGIASVASIDAEATEATFALSPIFQTPSGLYNVAIVLVGQSASFFSFAAPTSASAVVAPPVTSEEPTADFDETVTNDEPASPDEPGFTAADIGPDSSSITDDGSLAGDAEAGAPVAEVEVDGAAPTPQAAAPLTRLPTAVAAATARDGWRLFFGVILVVLAGGLFWAVGQDTRLPRLIGPLGAGGSAPEPASTDDPDVRGIGRYARARVGTPRLLR